MSSSEASSSANLPLAFARTVGGMGAFAAGAATPESESESSAKPSTAQSASGDRSEAKGLVVYPKP